MRLWSEALRRVGANFQPQMSFAETKAIQAPEISNLGAQNEIMLPTTEDFFFVESKKCFKTYLFLSWFNLVNNKLIWLRQNIFMNRVVICFLKYFRAYWSAKLLSDSDSMLEVVTVFICSMHRFHHESDCKAIA